MEDSRRPFTPFIQADSPSPDSSPSPERGRGRKSGKNNSGETSTSPGRKKDSTGKDSKKENKKDTGKNSQASKKEPEPEATPTKGVAKASVKNSKTPGKGSGELIESSLKMVSNDLSDLGTNRTQDEVFRPESANNLRVESSLSQHAPSIMTEEGYVPFSVEPAFGKIEPGKTVTFKVKFSPLNLNDYQARILCQIPNTEDGKIGPMIAVKGHGLLPYCHVELEESDYIICGRRDPDLPGPGGAASGLGLDPLTKVIEFECIGLDSKFSKKFEIINPTSFDYDFEWTRDDQFQSQRHEQFECVQPRGILYSGKKSEIEFVFCSRKVGIQEDFWQFKIPQFDLCIPFLLVGNVTEPKVIFDRSHISFKPLLVGKKGHEQVHLINQESKPLEFCFDQSSCYTEGRSSVVIVEPSTGILQPNSKLKISLNFQPREQRSHVFNLKCKISNSSKPLNLNIKGEGFSMLTALYCEDSNVGNNIEFSDTMINEIHMGEVEKNEICIRNLYVFNTGKHTVNFEWFLSSQLEESLSCFQIEPQMDLIGPGDKKHCVLKYTAKHERSTIANLILKVENGSVYHIHLDGIAVRPDLQSSFNEYDFGPSFIYKAGMNLKSTMLTLTNRGNKDLNISCLTDFAQSCFQFDFKQVILLPGKSTQSKITFLPRDSKDYNENVTMIWVFWL